MTSERPISSLSANITHHTLPFAGTLRKYLLHVPRCAAASPSAVPLLLMFHGWLDTAEDYAGLGSRYHNWSDGWANLAEAHCFVVVWPEGLSESLGDKSHPFGGGSKFASWNGDPPPSPTVGDLTETHLDTSSYDGLSLAGSIRGGGRGAGVFLDTSS